MFNVIKSVSVQTKPTVSFIFTASKNATGKVYPTIGSMGSRRTSASTGSPTSMDKIQHTQEPTQKDRDVITNSLEDGYSTRSDEEGFGGSFTGNDSLSSREQDKIVHANSPGTFLSPNTNTHVCMYA
ncbi:hypothetical protein HanOQP8_Chr16g0638111 [Helianthus annuus]|nr:hypothetical protein HanOQP8_Chr16g0638111 [Helianthus annuus]